MRWLLFSVTVSAILATRANDVPDARLTPGRVMTTDARTVCRPGYARTVRPRGSLWRRLKEAAYDRYALPRGRRSAIDADGQRHPTYTIDHLVPLELGGASTDLRNLWPQPRAAARRKDEVENRLHELVCSGRMPLSEAQHAIAVDWRTAIPRASHDPWPVRGH